MSAAHEGNEEGAADPYSDHALLIGTAALHLLCREGF